MLLIQANEISKAYGANNIFAGINFQLSTGEKMGVVGANGAGKTTLFRCLMGMDTPDKGEIKITEGIRVGYLRQNEDWDTEGTIHAELLDAFRDILKLKDDINLLADKMSDKSLSEGEMAQVIKEYGKLVDYYERNDGYNIDFQIKRVAMGLGFTESDEQREIKTLSGGERTRLALAKLLLRKPDLLLLDEPTNHLDMQMIEWLESFLFEFEGGVIVISHDRYFLDHLTNKIFALEHGQGTVYIGNYSQFIFLREEQKEAAQKAFDKQQKWIEKTEAYIEKYRAGIKAKQARGRQSQLSRLERLGRPEDGKVLGEIVFEAPALSGERVLDLKDVRLTYGERTILSNIDLSIRRGEGVALVGPNGAGKTSLLKIITGELQPERGTVRLGAKVKIGYFSQHHENLTLSNRVLDEIMLEFGFTENVSRKYLAVFLFQGDDVYKRINELSGGERARVVMLKLLLSNANFLILDEPTNHLDIPSKEAFENALRNYTGTFLVVSHDRYFLDRVVDRVLDLDNGKITEYMGDYTHFQNKKSAQQNLQNNHTVKVTEKKQNKGKEKIVKKDYMKLLMRTEKEIAELETELNNVEGMLAEETICNDYEKLQTLSTKYNELTVLLNEKMEQWESYMLIETEHKDA